MRYLVSGKVKLTLEPVQVECEAPDTQAAVRQAEAQGILAFDVCPLPKPPAVPPDWAED